ncbi:MAG: V-type ATPase subunit [Candidatus Omnitrophica bacterium]|nr:V-type ATPase subunit [Candidatus Omnitrophota bacterium]
MRNRNDYAYAVARVRSLETSLIPEEIFKEAQEAADLEEAKRIIFEFSGKEQLREIENSLQLEGFLRKEKDELNQEINGLLDDEELSSALKGISRGFEEAKLSMQKVNNEFLLRFFQHILELYKLSSGLRKKEEVSLPLAYSDLKKEAHEYTEKKDSYLLLEKLKSQFLLRYLQQARYITFGPEPVISYYFHKLNQLNLLRWIILGKINKIPEEQLEVLF